MDTVHFLCELLVLCKVGGALERMRRCRVRIHLAEISPGLSRADTVLLLCQTRLITDRLHRSLHRTRQGLCIQPGTINRFIFIALEYTNLSFGRMSCSKRWVLQVSIRYLRFHQMFIEDVMSFQHISKLVLMHLFTYNFLSLIWRV